MTNDLTKLELAALETFLGDDHAIARALQEQLNGIRVLKRTITGKGFFTELSVREDVPAAPVSQARLWIRGVEADVEGLDHGAGFLLLVTDGFLDTLEAYTYGEDWPEQIRGFVLRLDSPPQWVEE